jgi:hypothetical protein
VHATALARRGELVEAEEVARQAVVLAEQTDFLNHRAQALVVLGTVLGRRERSEAAHEALVAALGLYEEKGNLVAAARVRSALAPSAPV